jgi:uncharacterized membrane protein YdbT with pleckstrin-like domain
VPELYSTKNIASVFDSIKEDDEEIQWTGKPTFIPFILFEIRSALILLTVGILWLFVFPNLTDTPTEKGSFFWMIGFVPLLQGLYYSAKAFLAFRHTVYGYSNKRIMIRTGFTGADFKTTTYDKILTMEVTINMVERAYGVGSIRFFSGKTETDENSTKKLYDSWTGIDTPYEVFKMVSQTSSLQSV